MEDLERCARCGTYGIDASTVAESEIQKYVLKYDAERDIDLETVWLCGECAAKEPGLMDGEVVTISERKQRQDKALWDVSDEEKALIQASGCCRECGIYRRQYNGAMESFREPDLCEACAIWLGQKKDVR